MLFAAIHFTHFGLVCARTHARTMRSLLDHLLYSHVCMMTPNSTNALMYREEREIPLDYCKLEYPCLKRISYEK